MVAAGTAALEVAVPEVALPCARRSCRCAAPAAGGGAARAAPNKINKSNRRIIKTLAARLQRCRTLLEARYGAAHSVNA